MRRGLTALLALAALGASATPAAAQPTWWTTFGPQVVFEQSRLGDLVRSQVALFVGTGVHLLRLGPVLLGADAEGSAARLDADLGTVDDQIQVYRGRVGLRATWWVEDDEPYLVPYARVGAVYRSDRGDFIKDDGFGWYVALGVDYRFSERVSLGPFFAYEAVSLSIDTHTISVGLGLTFSF